MKKISLHRIFYAIAVLAAAILPSCVYSSTGENDGEARPATIIFKTSAAQHTRAGDPDPDKAVETFRVLFFKTNPTYKGLAFNKVFTNYPETARLDVTTGTFDIVFIANEQNDPTLSAQLYALTETATLNTVEGLYFSSAAFSESLGSIPMAGIARGVKVIDDNEIAYNGETITGNWNISEILRRLGVRVNFTFETNQQWIANLFNGIYVENVPDKVYILERTTGETPAVIYNNTGSNYESSRRYYSVFDDDSTNLIKNKKRIILPSNTFVTAGDVTKAFKFYVDLEAAVPRGATLGVDEENGDYTSPRNILYNFKGTVTNNDPIKLFLVSVKTWEEEGIVIE